MKRYPEGSLGMLNEIKKENLQAIRKSINHWMLDIRRPLKDGAKIYRDDSECLTWEDPVKHVPCCGDDCELCKIYDCPDCPLKRNGINCEIYNSPYSLFYNNPNLETSNNMICALVCTYWAEMDSEND